MVTLVDLANHPGHLLVFALTSPSSRRKTLAFSLSCRRPLLQLICASSCSSCGSPAAVRPPLGFLRPGRRLPELRAPLSRPHPRGAPRRRLLLTRRPLPARPQPLRPRAAKSVAGAPRLRVCTTSSPAVGLAVRRHKFCTTPSQHPRPPV
jgi:hypothetical protein